MTEFLQRADNQLNMLLSTLEFIEVPFERHPGGAALETLSKQFDRDGITIYVHFYDNSIRFGIGYDSKSNHATEPRYILEYWINKHRFERPTEDGELTTIINMVHRMMLNITELEMITINSTRTKA